MVVSSTFFLDNELQSERIEDFQDGFESWVSSGRERPV